MVGGQRHRNHLLNARLNNRLSGECFGEHTNGDLSTHAVTSVGADDM